MLAAPLLLWVSSFAHAADSRALRAQMEAPDGWKEISRNEEKQVGTVVIRHKEIDGAPCLEGTTIATLTPDALLAASIDIPNQPSWSTWSLPASGKLGSGNESFDYYQVLDNPFPIADRAWFLNGRVLRNGAERAFAWEPIDPATHPTTWADVQARFPDAVVTRVNLGDWTFTPEADGTTRIRYRICTDAGGNIPRWAGEYAATRTLPTNVGDIVREVSRRTRKTP